MKKLVTICVMCCMNLLLFSQSFEQPTILSASSGSGDNQQIVWTLGDFQTTTYSNNSVIMTQGFLQVYEEKVLALDDPISEIDIKLEVFPNPVVDQLNFKFKAEKVQKMIFKLYSTDGKLVHSEQVKSKEYSGSLGFKNFNSGMYILKIKSQTENFAKTYKILHHD